MSPVDIPSAVIPRCGTERRAHPSIGEVLCFSRGLLYHWAQSGTGRDWGTFEARVTTVGGGMIVEGTFKFAGGDGEYRGITGGGRFKSVMKSETEIECTWDGDYELAKSQAA